MVGYTPHYQILYPGKFYIFNFNIVFLTFFTSLKIVFFLSPMTRSIQSSVPPSSENWIDPANTTDPETTGLLTTTADEEGRVVEEWTPKSLGSSFI